MTKIGVIAPNLNLYNVAYKVMRELGLGDSVTLRIANMESGVIAAREFEAGGTEVIITRGGTGGLIMRSDVRIPLVEIPISGREMLAAIQEAKRLAQKENPRLAILAYRNMYYGIELFTQLSGLDMRIFEFGSNANSLESVVEQAVADGYEALIGGEMSTQIAAGRGICGVVLETTDESMRTAFLEAEKVAALRRLDETRLQRLRMILDLFPDGVVAVDQDGRIQFTNPSAYRLLGITPAAVGKCVDPILPALDVTSCLESGKASLNIIYPFKTNSLVVNIRPIRVQVDITGAVVTLQESGNIREIEAKLRDKHYSKGLTAPHHFRDIAGDSLVMRQTVRKAELYAATRGTILINGETGTGKEIFAQSIHNASPYRQGPFVAVNCAALPASLLES